MGCQLFGCVAPSKALLDGGVPSVNHIGGDAGRDQQLRAERTILAEQFIGNGRPDAHCESNRCCTGPTEFDVRGRKGRLEPGTIVSRIGKPESPFVSPAGTPLSLRGLPPGHPGTPETLYTVQQPIYVIQGQIAPYNGSPGGAIQWILPDDVSKLVGGALK